jgi:hypothetical protein
MKWGAELSVLVMNSGGKSIDGRTTLKFMSTGRVRFMDWIQLAQDRI